MKLMTKEIEQKLPRLYETEDNPNRTAVVKFFTPWSNRTWYISEYDPETGEMFGLVNGFELEYGYSTIAELESVQGPGGLKIERDLYWKSMTFEAIEQAIARGERP